MDRAVDTTGLIIMSGTCCGQEAQSVNDTSAHPVADLALEVAGGWWTRFAQIPFGLQLLHVSCEKRNRNKYCIVYLLNGLTTSQHVMKFYFAELFPRITYA